jgi:hypothetical protein
MNMTHTQVLDLCQYIDGELETARGNCGMFALALASVLGKDKCEFHVSVQKAYPDAYMHVAVKYKRRLYHGKGHIYSFALKMWAYDEGDDPDYAPMLKRFPCDEKAMHDIYHGTGWMERDVVFERYMREYLGLEYTEEMKEVFKDCPHEYEDAFGARCMECGEDLAKLKLRA